MTDELFDFCKQIKEGGIQGLCDCVLKDAMNSLFDEKISTKYFRLVTIPDTENRYPLVISQELLGDARFVLPLSLFCIIFIRSL